MKLLVLSDLHVEFAPFEPDLEASEAADVVVLAGDIHKGVQGMDWARKTFQNQEIIYVSGNHEFYGAHWDLHLTQLRLHAAINNIHFLENDSVIINGIRFCGATLWTDFEFFGQTVRLKAMQHAENRLSDFRLIKADQLDVKLAGLTGETAGISTQEIQISPLLTPTHTVLRHRESLAWLQDELEQAYSEEHTSENKAKKVDAFTKTVVVTHHYPNKRSTAAKWANDPLTAAFGSKLSLDLLTQADLWIHGHTHDSCNYRLGDSKKSVRVVCNPRGYPMGWQEGDFENQSFNPGMLVEI